MQLLVFIKIKAAFQCMTTGQMFIGLLLIFLCSCAQKKRAVTFPTLPDYNLSNPRVIHLRTDLDEISGINFYPKDSSIFAINDELGVLYKIYLRDRVQVKKWKFSNDADYEDVVLYDSTFYVLQSNGDLKEFIFHTKEEVEVDKSKNPLTGSNNFETLYYDESIDKLILLCKNCASDKKGTVSAYTFNPSDQTFSGEILYQLDSHEIAEKLGNKNIKFKPSAAAIHPITKDLYIISSVEKAMVIATREGRIKDAVELNPALFKQPEGLTFTPSGDMMVSNEAAEIGAPTILIFKYKQSPNEKG